jgi:imidazolonepropionase-like amidohydrolase
MDERIRLLCSRVFDPVGKRALKDRYIDISGERIEAVGDMGSLPEGAPADAGVRVVDLRGLFVMPGLIDAHAHLGISGQADPGARRPKETAAVWTLRGLKNAQADLTAGFTSLRVCGDRNFISEAVRDSIARGEFDGPRLMTCGQYIGAPGGHADDSYGPYLADPEMEKFLCCGPYEVMRAARYDLKHGAQFIKIMASGGIMSPGGVTGVCQMTLEEMKAACGIAKMHGVHSSAHAYGNEAIKTALRAGIDNIDHGIVMDEEAVDLMLERGASLVPTLIAVEKIVRNGNDMGLPEWAVRKASEVRDTHRKSLEMCYRAGVPICFGTDAGSPFNPHGHQTEEAELLFECGIAPADILCALTINAARLMRMDKSIGSAEPGKFADIAAFGADPLVSPGALSDCRFVMKGGRIVRQ